MLPRKNVEMHGVFPAPELGGKRDGRVIAVVGLDIDHMDAALLGDVPDGGGECGGDALAPEVLRDGQVVDVELAALLLERGKDVAG